jgi:molybdate transport system substrate-binding protein
VTSGKVDGIEIPDEQNVVADYPIAKLSGAKNGAGAGEFISYVLSPAGQVMLAGAGFQKA